MQKAKQTVLITGSTKGIGFHLARHLVQQGGFQVILNARHQEALTKAVEELQAQGNPEDVMGVRADIQEPQDVESMFESIANKYKKLDIVINNAALAGHSKQPLHSMPIEEWQAIMSTNVQGTFLCYRSAVQLMQKLQHKGGKIINISSGITKNFTSATFSQQLNAYALSKHTVEDFTRLAAQEVFSEHIGVCCLSIDGSYQSQMTQDFFSKEQFTKLHTPEQLLPIFDFLCTAEWSQLTGRIYSSSRFAQSSELEKLSASAFTNIPLAVNQLPIPEKKKYLCSGENPNAPTSRILELLGDEALQLGRYPRTYAIQALKRTIARKFDVQDSMVFVGNGTVSCVESIMQLFVPSGHHVLAHEATWNFIGQLITARGLHSTTIGLDLEGKRCLFNLDKMTEQITASTRLIYLTNPNNPTGHNIEKQEFLDFLQKVPKTIPVVVDECYADFSVRPNRFTVAELLPETDHPIIALRTLSKLYGLANLRIGYVIAHPLVIHAIEHYHLPWTVSDINALCANKVLRDEDYARDLLQKATVEREFMEKELDAIGVGYIESDAMFLLIDLPDCSYFEFRRALDKRGVVLVPVNFKNRFVYQIGKRHFNQQVIDVLTGYKQQEGVD